MPIRTGYTSLQIALHWLIAVLILSAWWFSDGMGDALDIRLKSGASGITGNTWHVWLGGAVFLLILIRIVVRLIKGMPDLVPGSSALVDAAAVWGHRLLYALMIVVPILGSLTWYGKIQEFGDYHAYAANALMIVALGHAAVALYHHYIVKDATLRRMLRPETTV